MEGVNFDNRQEDEIAKQAAMLQNKLGPRKAGQKKSLLPQKQKTNFDSGDHFMQKEREKQKNEEKNREEDE